MFLATKMLKLKILNKSIKLLETNEKEK